MSLALEILVPFEVMLANAQPVLLEAPARPHLKNSVLLTVDLTKAVVDEAIERKDSVIVAYRKYLFSRCKFITSVS